MPHTKQIEEEIIKELSQICVGYTKYNDTDLTSEKPIFIEGPAAIEVIKLIEQTIHHETTKAVDKRDKEILAILDDEFKGIPEGKSMFYHANDANEAVKRIYRVLQPTNKPPIQEAIENKFQITDHITNNTKEEKCNEIIDKGGTYNGHCYQTKPCPIHNTKEDVIDQMAVQSSYDSYKNNDTKETK